MMLQSFYKYLILYNKANMPGVGHFELKRIPASFNPEKNELTAPHFSVIFTQANAMADKHFYTFLKNEEELDEVAAIRQFNDWSCNVWERIHENKELELKDIGHLIIDNNGTLQFIPNNFDADFFPSVKLHVPEDNIRLDKLLPADKNKKEKKVKPLSSTSFPKEKEVKILKAIEPGDYWWMIALVLGVLSAIAIIYYYTALV